MNEFGDWIKYFTPREVAEIRLASLYADSFDHGTVGHNEKIIIAKMRALLDANAIKNLPPFTRASDVKAANVTDQSPS